MQNQNMLVYSLDLSGQILSNISVGLLAGNIANLTGIFTLGTNSPLSQQISLAAPIMKH